MPKSAGVWVVVLTEGEERAEAVAESLRRLLDGRGRPVRVVVEPYHHESRAERLRRGLDGADLPLVLVTTATEPWTEAHWKPLIEAIDRSDHVLGRRRRSLLGRLGRWLPEPALGLPVRHPAETTSTRPAGSTAARRSRRFPPPVVLAVPRRGVLAKASFFAQLVDEEDVPPLAASQGPPGFWGDFLDVFRKPAIRREPSAPAEDPEGDDEGDDRPGGEDQEVRPDLQQPGPFEDHPA